MNVSVEFPAQNEHHSCTRRGGEGAEEEQSLSTSVLLSKPILALEFSCMEMKVEAPTVVSQYFNHSLRTPWTNPIPIPLYSQLSYICWKFFPRSLVQYVRDSSQQIKLYSHKVNSSFSFCLRYLLFSTESMKDDKNNKRDLFTPYTFLIFYWWSLQKSSSPVWCHLRDKEGKAIFSLSDQSNFTLWPQLGLNSRNCIDTFRKLLAEADFAKMTWTTPVIFQVVKMVPRVMPLWLWRRKECCHKLESTHQPEEQKPFTFIHMKTDFLLCDMICHISNCFWICFVRQDLPAVPRTRLCMAQLFLVSTVLLVYEQEFYFLWVE